MMKEIFKLYSASTNTRIVCVDGIQKFSCTSEIFSIGKLLHRQIVHLCANSFNGVVKL
jgi:hypothetical protein